MGPAGRAQSPSNDKTRQNGRQNPSVSVSTTHTEDPLAFDIHCQILNFIIHSTFQPSTHGKRRIFVEGLPLNTSEIPPRARVPPQLQGQYSLQGVRYLENPQASLNLRGRLCGRPHRPPPSFALETLPGFGWHLFFFLPFNQFESKKRFPGEKVYEVCQIC